MHRQRGGIILASAEREAKSLHARIKKLDFKLTIGNWTGLPDQLVQALFGHRADALFVNVNSVTPRLAAVHRPAPGISRTFLASRGP